MRRIAFDIADPSLAQMDVDAAAAGTHVAGGLLELVAYRLLGVDLRLGHAAIVPDRSLLRRRDPDRRAVEVAVANAHAAGLAAHLRGGLDLDDAAVLEADPGVAAGGVLAAADPVVLARRLGADRAGADRADEGVL